jgi:acetyltransferase-like isoleucine patch superfamily enzyme
MGRAEKVMEEGDLKVLSKAAFWLDIIRTLFLTHDATSSVKLKIRFRNSTMLRPLEVSLSNLDNIHISKNVFIHTGMVLRLLGDCKLFVGEDTYIGPYSHISGVDRSGSIIIGKKVMIADCVYISTAYHKYEDVTKAVKDQGYEPKGNVIIGDGCWIGGGSYIMPGVKVGKNSVIGANSVVTHDIPPNSVAAGSPARIIRQYSPTEKIWLDQ